MVVPYSYDTNDGKTYRGTGGVAEYYKALVDTFDKLYEEGETSPKMMSVGIHPRVTGRPGKSKVLEQFIQYAKSHPDVWFARRGDIAKWWWEKYG